MKAYIITLQSSQNAHRQLENCLYTAKKYKWDVEPFWAVNGKLLEQTDFKNENLFLNPQTKIYRRPGAQGCFLSHWKLWKLCISVNEPLIVLESDANIIAPLPNIDFSKGLVKLHTDKSTKVSDITGKWSKGAHAYALTPQHAKQLIDGIRATEVKPADKAIGTKFVDWRYLDDPVVDLKKTGKSTTSWMR